MTDSKERDNMTDSSSTKNGEMVRWALIIGLVVVAFFGAYRFASARTGQTAQGATGLSGTVASAASPASGKPAVSGSGAAASSAGCACCGGASTPAANGITGPATTGTAAIAGGVQKIAIDVTTVYNPNTIKLKAGVPAEITFSQAQGCTQVVQSADLGFSEDLSAGPKTVKLQGLQPGTYAFSCGMNMVFGKIVVE
jgi:plastocyanin